MVTISQIGVLPPDMAEVLDRAGRESFGALDRLVSEFESGANTFSAPSEALFEARDAGRLVGVAGLNVDPFDASGSSGRLRRLYVLPQCRRLGVGRAIVEAVERSAQSRFRVLRLFTDSPDADRFYVALGYEPVSGSTRVSHRKFLGDPVSRPVGGPRTAPRAADTTAEVPAGSGECSHP